MTAASCTANLLGTACSSGQTALCCDGATLVSILEISSSVDDNWDASMADASFHLQVGVTLVQLGCGTV